MDSFWSARLQAHWATQPLAAIANLVLPHASDDSHTSLVWSIEQKALLLQPASQGRSFQAGLRIDDLTLLFLGDGGEVIDSCPLLTRTLADAYAFCQRTVQSLTGIRESLVPPTEGPPPHAVEHGAPFDATTASLKKLGGLYADAHAILERVREAHDAREPVRCWPHHFDIATVIEREGGPTVGAGMQPGDESYEKPYYYVNASPAPVPSDLQPLRRGFWNTEGWIGAVFFAEEGGIADAQQFLEGAIAILEG